MKIWKTQFRDCRDLEQEDEEEFYSAEFPCLDLLDDNPGRVSERFRDRFAYLMSKEWIAGMRPDETAEDQSFYWYESWDFVLNITAIDVVCRK